MRNTIIVFAVCCFMTAAAPGAVAQTKARAPVNIPAQELVSALKTFARDRKVQLVFRSEVIADLMTAGAVGEMTTDEALAKLLAGTPLTYKYLDEKTVTIVPVTDKEITSGTKPADQMWLAMQDAQRKAGKPAADGNAQSAEPKQKVEVNPESEVTVTGTHIRGVSAPTGSPVITIHQDEIERSGYTTTADVVRTLPQNFQGSFDELARMGNVTTTDNGQNTNGGSGADLRGLGADGTLTLLNGRRLSASGQSVAADLSLIPLSAVERIEAVVDGASAIYGSDAVGGVVNVILKDTYSGAQTLVEHSHSARGSYETLRVAQTLARAWGSGGVLLSYEYRDQEPLYQTERNFVQTPVVNATLVPPAGLDSLVARVNQQVFPRVRLSLDALAAKRENATISPLGFVTEFEAEQISGTLAADVTLTETWSGVFSASKSKSDGRMSIGPPPVAINHNLNNNAAWDAVARFSGRLATLPGGELSLAFGGEHRSAELENIIVRTGARRVGERDIDVAYAEVNVPVVGAGNARAWMASLAFSLAGRHEEYNDFGTSDTYKLGWAWQFNDRFGLRGTYGTSFRAPSLIELRGATSSAIQRQNDPLSSTGTSVVFLKTGANPDLTAQEAQTGTIGFDYRSSRFPGLRAALTYFDTDYADRIGLPNPTLQQPTLFAPFIVRNPTAQQVTDAYAAYPVASNPSGFTPAQIQVIMDLRPNNTASSNVNGFDLSVGYSLDTAAGYCALQAAGSHFLNYRVQLVPDGPAFNREDTIYYPSSWKVRGSAGCDRGGWSLNAAVNYLNSHMDHSFAIPLAIGGFTTTDVRMAYRFQQGFAKDLLISLAARNLFDKDPPRVAGQRVGFDTTNANPLGRVLSFSVRKDW